MSLMVYDFYVLVASRSVPEWSSQDQKTTWLKSAWFSLLAIEASAERQKVILIPSFAIAPDAALGETPSFVYI